MQAESTALASGFLPAPRTIKAYIGTRPCGCVTFVQMAGVESVEQEKRKLLEVAATGRRLEVVDALGCPRLASCSHYVATRLTKKQRNAAVLSVKQDIEALVSAAHS